LRGLFGLDLIRGQDGLWLIEVNPRYTASMELLEGLSGRSFVAEHCAEFVYTLADVDANVSQNYLSKHLSTGHSSLTGEPRPRAGAKPLSKLLSLGLTATGSSASLGKLIVYADNSGIVGDRYQAVIKVIKPLSTVIAGVITKDLPIIGSVIECGSPICTVIASADSPQHVRELLSQAAVRIRQSLDPLPAPS